jgi:hypothetical protein
MKIQEKWEAAMAIIFSSLTSSSSSPWSLPSPLLLILNIFKISKIFLTIQWVSRLITVLRSTTLSISINRDPGTVYEFVLNPENLP